MSPAGLDAAWIIAGALLLVALLIASRWVYRKYIKRRAWAMINAEREDNKRRFRRSAEAFVALAQQLQTNSAAIEPLRSNSNVPPQSLTGLVAWNCDFPEFNDSAWQTVTRTGAHRLFQPQEAREVEELYTDFRVLQASMAAVRREIDAGSRHARVQAAETGPQWIADELALMQAIRIAHDKLGADMRHFTRLHTDFVPSV